MAEEGGNPEEIIKEKQDFLKLLSSAASEIQKHRKSESQRELNCKESRKSLKVRCDEKEAAQRGWQSTGNEMHATHQSSHSRLKTNTTTSTERKLDLVKVRVFDKLKGKRKTFTCRRDMFCKQIESFRGDLYLDCDITVFGFISRWISKGGELALQSDLLHGVIEVASSLNAPLLLTTCLRFWRANVRSVMRDGEWETLDENIITGLANLFTNCSLEDITDIPKLQEVLYQKFILFLNDPNPSSRLGHFATTAYIYRCLYCGKILGKGAESVECQLTVLNSHGDVTWAHCGDPDWSLQHFVLRLKEKHSHWRFVYWALWGACHFLCCSACYQWFPVTEMLRCLYHPNHNFSSSVKVQYYTCCGQPCDKFQPIIAITGCKFKKHTPVVNSSEERRIIKIYEDFQHLISTSHTSTANIKFQMTSGVNEVMFMNKLSLIKERYCREQSLTKAIKVGKHGWLSECSIGLNQDNQREFEERQTKYIQKVLSRREIEDQKMCLNSKGGSYVNAAAEWWSNLQNEMRNITQE